ncbi:hypothetical protein JCM3765_002508 [Sporobolomyces pararoseus]
MGDSLAVVLMNAEGDKFNASYLAGGVKGGKLAAEHITALAKEKTLGAKVIVYLVSDNHHNLIGSGQTQAFLRGFASTSNSCFVVEPIQAHGSTLKTGRVLQLLQIYTPLKNVTEILLGSLHNNQLYSYLRNLSPQEQKKFTLCSTITVAPPYRVLVDSGTFEAWRGFEPLFGGLAIPDVSILSIKETVETRVEEVHEEMEEEEADTESEEEEAARNEIAAPTSPEDGHDFNWDSFPESASGSSDESSEWEVAGPRSNKKPTQPRNGSTNGEKSADMNGEGASTANNGTSSRRSERGGRDRNGRSTTSGASRRRKQRERVQREQRRSQRRRQERSGPFQGVVSPLPAWEPPHLTFSDPHPCIHHYLRKNGCETRDCPYSHDYKWRSEEEKNVLYPLFIKSILCVKFVKGQCKKGEECINGHRCPYSLRNCRYGSRCYYSLQGLPHSSD